VYHDYNVDEHSLLVVEAVDQLYQATAMSEQFRRRVLVNLFRPHLLRLACLFHDLGKSRGAAGHSQRGALMVPLAGERLGLPPADIRTLIFLVEEHLTLSKVSQRRDVGDPALLNSLAAKCVTRERLDLLYLLTYCDASSVGHGSYPLWKDALLTELYTAIRYRLPERESLEPAAVANAELPGEESPEPCRSTWAGTRLIRWRRSCGAGRRQSGQSAGPRALPSRAAAVSGGSQPGRGRVPSGDAQAHARFRERYDCDGARRR